MKSYNRSDTPDLSDLPWELPLSDWSQSSNRLVDVPHGLSRHTVKFAVFDGAIYAFKELPAGWAEIEYHLLDEMIEKRLPVVIPAGYRDIEMDSGKTSVLITRYLEFSIPYRSLFMSSSLESIRNHLLDAMAGLLVQLHLAGVYWGDCTLSNTLFRRDAGALQAYLVDAETAEVYPQGIPPVMRMLDLDIMEENVDGDLAELRAANQIVGPPPASDLGHYIRQQYQRLWDEINREEVIQSNESYRIQERIRALNELGFSIGNAELLESGTGDQLRLRFAVTDRNFHHNQLQNLTGLDVRERQARQMMNEIQEYRARLSRENNRSTPLSAAAYEWMEQIYKPVTERLRIIKETSKDLAELYCELLEHKWYLSERERRDVGHQTAADDYLQRFGAQAEEGLIF
jgi:hypothetical protein